MRPVTLLQLSQMSDPLVRAALDEVQRASQQYLVNDPTTFGTSLATAADAATARALLGVTRAPWVDVRDKGAVGDAVTDDSTAFANAVASLAPLGGGIVYVPPGIYLLSSGVTLTTNIRLMGAGRTVSYLKTKSDVSVITLSAASQNFAENLTVFGKGSSQDDGTFGGASVPAVKMLASGGYLHDMTIQGGFHALELNAIDAVIVNVDCAASHGPSNVNILGASWHYRCKWDNGGQTGLGATNSPPYPNWAAATPYTAGHVVKSGGYLIMCTVGGTSAGVAPTLRNYTLPITDNSATWQLFAPDPYTGLTIGGTAGENHFDQIDFTGSGSYAFAIDINTTGSLRTAVFHACVISEPIRVQKADWVEFTDCEMGGVISVLAGYAGKLTIANNWCVGAANISIAAAVNDFIITNNHCNGGAINVALGASDHYIIANNVRVTVTDAGTGVNKTVAGNVA